MRQCGAATFAVSIVTAAVMGVSLDGAEGTVIASAMGSTMPLTASPPAAEESMLLDNISTFFKTYSVAGITRPVDGLLLAALIIYAAGPFSCVASTDPPQQLRMVLQGIQRLGLVFEQMFIASIAVVVITLLDAATVWPDIVIGTSAVFFVVALVRSASLGWLLSAKRESMDDIDGQLAAYQVGCAWGGLFVASQLIVLGTVRHHHATRTKSTHTPHMPIITHRAQVYLQYQD